MGLDKGERIEINNVKADRSDEYIASVKASISKLKNEETSVKEEIKSLKEKLSKAEDQYSNEIAKKQNDISLLNGEIKKQRDVLAEMKASLIAVMADYEKENKQMKARREQVDNAIAEKIAIAEKAVEDKNSFLDNLDVQADALNIEIGNLVKDKNALGSEISVLNDKKTGMIAAADGLAVSVRESERELSRLTQAVESKKIEINDATKNYNLLMSESSALKAEIESLSAEKQNIINAGIENARRAKELQDLIEDIRIERLAQANKNASLVKREQALRDAQAKI